MTQPFGDPKSQSEPSFTFLSQTMQPSRGQQVRLWQIDALSSPYANFGTFNTPRCPSPPILPRVVGKYMDPPLKHRALTASA